MTMLKSLSTAERTAIEEHRRGMCELCGRDIGFDEALEDWELHCAVKWREARQREYLAKQREEILKHKWIESEKANRDLGAAAVLDWINNYAARWRAWYDQTQGPREGTPS